MLEVRIEPADPALMCHICFKVFSEGQECLYLPQTTYMDGNELRMHLQCAVAIGHAATHPAKEDTPHD